MLGMLEWALQSIGVHDVRIKDGKNLIAELKQFVEISAAFDIESNEAALKPYLQMLKKQIAALEESVKQDWNTKLGNEDEPTEVVTLEGLWMFCKASPLKGPKKTYFCEGEGCDKTYSNYQYYQSHLKSIHQITKKIEPPRVTCRLAHAKASKPIAIDQIGSHLKRVHGLAKENAGEFRGFLSTDGGETYNPIWLPADAPDPQPPADVNDAQPPADVVVVNPEQIADVADPEQLHDVAEPEQLADVADRDQLHDVADLEQLADDTNPQLPAKGADPQPPAKGADPQLPADDSDLHLSAAENNRDEVGVGGRLETMPEMEVETVSADPIQEEEDKQIEFDKKMEPSIKKLPDLVYDYDVPDLFCEDSDFDQLQSKARRRSVPISAQDIFGNVDSDVEDGDSPSYTQRRLKNKGERFQKRNQNKNEDVKPHETEDSKIFIEDFSRYLTKRSLNESDTSTNNKAIAYLFTYHDSFFNYMLKRNPGFKLSSLIAFHDSGLVELTDPVHGWTDSISGDSGNENPSRRREQLKNHAFLRDFVMVKLNTADFGTNLEDLMKKDKLKSNLEQLKRDVKDSRIWGQTKKQINQNKQKVDNAKLLVNPAQNANEAKSVSVYLSSQEFRSREEKMMTTWQKFENGESIGVKEFNDLANFVRHLLGRFILLILILLLIELFFSFY